MTTAGSTREVASIQHIPQYTSFKQNSGEHFRATWPSCFIWPYQIYVLTVIVQKKNSFGNFYCFIVFCSVDRELLDLIKRTASAGESNSVLVIGPRGSGKSMVSTVCC